MNNFSINAIEKTGESSKTTHGAVTAVDACRFFGGLIYGALNGAQKEVLLSKRYAPIPEYWTVNKLFSEIDEIAFGSYKNKNPPEIVSSGYVVKSLEAALWAFYNSSSFKEGCLMAVNLGNDADTTGAIYGQLAGAYYGIEKIPIAWIEKIVMRDQIISYSEKLWDIAMQAHKYMV